MIYLTAGDNQTVFSFNFDYINHQYVKVRVGERDLVYGSDYTVNDNKQITLTKAPQRDTIVFIYRQTPTDRSLSWKDASVLRAKDLNLSNLQLLHITEEAHDRLLDEGLSRNKGTREWDAKDSRIVNVGYPTDSKHAVTIEYLDKNREKWQALMSNLTDSYKATINQQLQDMTAFVNTSKADIVKNTDSVKESATQANTWQLESKRYSELAERMATQAKNSAKDSQTSEQLSKEHSNNAQESLAEIKGIADRMNDANTAMRTFIDTSKGEMATTKQSAWDASEESKTYRNESQVQAELAKGYMEQSRRLSGGDFVLKTDLDKRLGGNFNVTQSLTNDNKTLALLNTDLERFAFNKPIDGYLSSEDAKSLYVGLNYYYQECEAIEERFKQIDRAISNTHTEGVATVDYVDNRFKAIIGGSAEALDTLYELGKAINNDANFAGTMTLELSKKADKDTTENALLGKADKSQLDNKVDVESVYLKSAIDSMLNTYNNRITTLEGKTVDAYTRTQSDERYQAKGNYVTKGDVYNRAEANNRFQTKGSYLTRSDVYTYGNRIKLSNGAEIGVE